MRKAPLKRRGRVKPVNRKRRQSEFARCYGSKERVAWVKSLGCFVCRNLHPMLAEATAHRVQNAHTETDGMGRKANANTIIPLCSTHHQCYDQHKAPFDTPMTREAAKNIAAVVEAGWQSYLNERQSA